MTVNIRTWLSCGLYAGWGHYFFLGGYEPHWFSKVRSTERKLRSWERIVAKISVFGAQILQKSERNDADFFFEKRKGDGILTDTRCEKVGLWRDGGAWKKGGGRIHTRILLTWVPPAPGQNCSTTVPPPPMKWNYVFPCYDWNPPPRPGYTRKKKSKQTIFVLFSCQMVNALDPGPPRYGVRCQLQLADLAGPRAIFFSVLQYSITHTDLAPRQCFNATRT